MLMYIEITHTLADCIKLWSQVKRFIHLFISWSVQMDLTPRGKWWAKATQCLHAQAGGKCTPLLIATHIKILEPETWWGNIGERLNCKFPQYQYQYQSHLPLVKGQLSASLTPRAPVRGHGLCAFLSCFWLSTGAMVWLTTLHHLRKWLTWLSLHPLCLSLRAASE